MFNRKEFNERIQKDFEKFKNSTLELNKELIFERGFEIDFKTYMAEYLQNDEITYDELCESLSLIEGSILDELFMIYLNNDSYYTYEDLCEDVLDIFQNNTYSEDELD